MYVLVSESITGLGECVKSIKDVDIDNVSCLIFHSAVDSELDIVRALSRLQGKEGVKVIYINKNINPLFYCVFTGLGADIYDSEEFLQDREVLQYLIDNYKNTKMTLKSPDEDIETLAKGIAAISSSDISSLEKLVSNSYWIKTLNTAVSNVDTALSRASQININVVEMLKETSNFISMLEEGHATVTEELEKLKKLVMDMEKKSGTNSPFIFSTYRVPVNVKNVLYVRVWGYCRYLNSFFLSYQHYLRMNKQVKSKILLVLPRLTLNMKRYKDLPRLDMDSIEIIDLKNNDFYVTFEPKRSVLETFFSQQDIDVFIVIDMLFGDILLEGHMVKDLHAISGSSDLKKFNLRPEKVISCITGTQKGIIIPHIKNYVESNENTRRTMYFNKCGEAFKKLDNYIFTEGR